MSVNDCNNVPLQENEGCANNVIPEMLVHELRQRIEKMQKNVVKEVDSKFDIFIAELLSELNVNQCDIQRNEIAFLFKQQNGKSNKHVNRLQSNNKNYLPEKEFSARNSLLNDLFEIKHIKTIYHIFIAILFILWLNTLTHDFVAYGTINLGLTPIIIGFGKLHYAFFIWCILQTVSFLIYFGLKVWAKSLTVKEIFNHPSIRQFVNRLFLLVFIFIQIGLVLGTIKLVLLFDLPPASSITILMEMIRFLMKNHAFVRSNVPVVFTSLNKNEHNKVTIPIFGKFIYFMFAPTLIYRDNYPRTKSIRWNLVLWNLMEVVAVIFYVSFIFERFLLPYFRNFGTITIQPTYMVLSIFGCMMPGTIAFLCGFYCLLHSWLNATGEILKFADRMFYQDWWNSSSFDVYFRTWNIVVHDWLYTYIYKDMYEIVFKKSKAISALIVFSVSAIFHELILAVSFRFFYPVLFILFQGCGFQLMFIKNRKHKSFGNTFLWIAMAIGNGLCISLYCMEYFARQNCPMNHNSILEYYIPVSWTCNGIQSNDENYISNITYQRQSQ